MTAYASVWHGGHPLGIAAAPARKGKKPAKPKVPTVERLRVTVVKSKLTGPDQLLSQADLCQAAALKTGLSIRQVDTVLTAALHCIKRKLVTGGEVSLRGFGTFEPVNRAGRLGRNPQTGEAKVVPPYRTVSFRASKSLKALVNPKALK